MLSAFKLVTFIVAPLIVCAPLPEVPTPPVPLTPDAPVLGVG